MIEKAGIPRKNKGKCFCFHGYSPSHLTEPSGGGERKHGL